LILRGKCLLDTLDKRCDRYISAIVLGLNDALVEMTGALAGFTMALHDNRLIALAGLTTGVAATLSMAASEFLAKKADPAARHPYTAAIYTGTTYLITVALLLLPFFMLDDPFTSLGCCLLTAASIITMFTWAVARLRQKPFLGNCLQMLSISFSVSAIAFGISWAARYFWDLKGM